MSIIGKGFWYILYFAIVIALGTAIGLSFRSDRTTVTKVQSGSHSTSAIQNKITSKDHNPPPNKPRPATEPQGTGNSSGQNNPPVSGIDRASNLPSTSVGPNATNKSGTLVNTGPGNILGSFLAVSLAGMFLHRRFITSRR